MTARATILRDLRDALGAHDTQAPYAVSLEALKLLEDAEEMRPALPHADSVENFLERVAGPKVGATTDRIAGIDALPEAVARFLADRALDPRVSLQPNGLLTVLAWDQAVLELSDAVDDGVYVCLAPWGIAETGSLVIHSGHDTPVLPNFLAGVHVIAVHTSRILGHLEDYAAAARAADDPLPRNVCMITGASGTTDIEGSLVRGAHGPRELHIIVIDADHPQG